MIPFAALACLVETAGGEVLELSLADLSPLGFTFRAPRAWSQAIASGVMRVTLRAHRFSGDEGCTLAPGQFDLTVEEIASDWTLWRLETEEPACRALLRQYMADFSRYAELKQAGDDAAMARALTGYPADAETVTGTTFAAQRAGWLQGLAPDAGWIQTMTHVPELAASLNRPELWTRFLEQDAASFSAWYWAAHGLPGHPLAARPFNAAVIGSQFCPLLCPDEALLHRLMQHAADQGVRPVLALPPVSEGRLDAVLALLEGLCSRLSGHAPLEVVVNDLGAAWLLKDRPDLTLTAGVLLTKRRKDVRLSCMQPFGGHGALLAESPASDAAWCRWLASQGVARLTAEFCGIASQPPAMAAVLHLPFYQMATAGRCTLAARCETGDRALQSPRTACTGWCADHAFLYPEALHMVGRYNSLFGLDARSLTDGAYLRGLMGGKVQRIVIDLL